MSEEDVKALTPYEFGQLMEGYSLEKSIDADAIKRIRKAGRIMAQAGEGGQAC
jgi:hypothetical protein